MSRASGGGASCPARLVGSTALLLTFIVIITGGSVCVAKEEETKTTPTADTSTGTGTGTGTDTVDLRTTCPLVGFEASSRMILSSHGLSVPRGPFAQRARVVSTIIVVLRKLFRVFIHVFLRKQQKNKSGILSRNTKKLLLVN